MIAAYRGVTRHREEHVPDRATWFAALALAVVGLGACADEPAVDPDTAREALETRFRELSTALEDRGLVRNDEIDDSPGVQGTCPDGQLRPRRSAAYDVPAQVRGDVDIVTWIDEELPIVLLRPRGEVRLGPSGSLRATFDSDDTIAELELGLGDEVLLSVQSPCTTVP